LSLFVALGLLIAVHEYGHYRVAVACGVKVLRFSVGFGKPLLRWQPKGSPTEFVLGAFPLGGYVRMLDEREAPVPPEHERHLAFNTQPLRAGAAIVAAGPVANLAAGGAALCQRQLDGYAGAHGLSRTPGAGLGGRVGRPAWRRVGAQCGLGDEEPRPVRSFDDLRWMLTRGALESIRCGWSWSRRPAPRCARWCWP
jgi:regulator of sigma E protease